MIAPGDVRARFESMFRPRVDLDSNQFRIVCWRTGLEMILTHPLLGVGPEQVKAQFQRFVPPDIPRPLPTGWYGHLHNIYIHYAAERGIPTMLALLWLLGKVLADMLRGVRGAPPGRGDRKFILHGVTAVTVGTMVVGFFELNLGDSEVLLFCLGVIACGYSALQASEEPAQES
jgi:O-antigen ligase